MEICTVAWSFSESLLFFFSHANCTMVQVASTLIDMAAVEEGHLYVQVYSSSAAPKGLNGFSWSFDFLLSPSLPCCMGSSNDQKC